MINKASLILGLLLVLHMLMPAETESQAGDTFGFMMVAQWKRTNSESQTAYVMGAADALSLVSGHLGNEQKLQLLRSFGLCFRKMGRGVRIERIHGNTTAMINNAASRFQIAQTAVDRSVVAGWVELGVVDACPQ